MTSSHAFRSHSPASSPNVGNPERWASLVAGAAVAAYGLTRRSVSGTLIAGIGGALLWRGATGHCPIYSSLGMNTAGGGTREQSNVSVPYGKGIRVEQTATVNIPPEQLFSFWRNFANLPRFMDHLESVTLEGSNRSHWVAKGPAGMKAEWDAEIINEIPNELIGWRSVNGSMVGNAGSVHFTPTADGRGTELRVLLRYDPPAGKLGAGFSRLFGEDPDIQIAEDLHRLEELFRQQ
ncbi:MAG: cyclase/dehydrase [Acidobacteria bacterium]|nr:cyclase/dehydrase [Acidobacteriota bacterium]